MKGAKSDLSCPQEFEETVRVLRQAHQWTVQLVDYLQRFVRKHPKKMHNRAPGAAVNELESLGRTCDRLKNHFPDNQLSVLLEKTSVICTMVGKREASTQTQMYERAVLPIKVWTEEDYPRLLQELHKCVIFNTKMLKAQKAHASKPNELTKEKADEATTIYERQHALCKTELIAIKKVFRHHMTCIKLLVESQYKNAKFANEEILKALGPNSPISPSTSKHQ